MPAKNNGCFLVRSWQKKIGFTKWFLYEVKPNSGRIGALLIALWQIICRSPRIFNEPRKGTLVNSYFLGLLL